MKPLILFDFDGTLVDSVDAMLLSLNEVCSERGLSARFSREDFEDHPVERLVKKAGLWFWQVPGFVHSFREHFAKHMPEVDLHPGLVPLLRNVSSYAQLGIISTNKEDNIRAVLKRNDLEELFVFVRQAGFFSKSKVIRRARKEEAVDKFKTLYVGDEVRDVHAARRAGVDCLSVAWGLQGEAALLRARPRMLAHDVEEAEHLLKAWLVSRGD